MSKSFNALCYIRIYSDDLKKDIDIDVWKTIPLRGGSGFNYVSKRFYFNVENLDESISKLCSLCRTSYIKNIGNDDVGEMYLWIDKDIEIFFLNGIEISKINMKNLSDLNVDLIFSVEELFPNYEASEFKF